MAAKGGNEAIVDILLRRKADVNHKSNLKLYEASAIYISSQQNHLGIVKMLLDHGAKVALRVEE